MGVNPATASFYAVNPLPRAGLSSLFMTHPPTAERIRRLRVLDDDRCSPPPRTRSRPRPVEGVGAVAPTQDALYAEIDLALSWSERDLPERERTKHVHRLHPYLGKFVPQLVEAMLERYFRRGQRVLDPFAGSGTTLVQALESGLDATGVDIAAFNCLLMDVKTRRYNAFVLEHELRAVHSRIPTLQQTVAKSGGFVRRWY